MKPTKPMKLMIGRKVRLMRDVRNGWGDLFRAGTVMIVGDVWRGLELRMPEVCPLCGHCTSVSHVDWSKVEPVEEE